ncbi:MAG: hypothetical protein JWO02_461, partial [Solirubrobacterales bacterium]|nr:hypothetical protein [Solirubrobacterales bacterium]
MAALIVVVSVGVWASGRGGGSPPAPPELVRAERGEVAVTVGGIGHVATLTEAALLAVPGAGSAAASGSNAGSSAGSAGAAGGTGGAGGGTLAPADTVFPAVAGHVARVLVKPGDRVVAGQSIAVIDDDGTVAGTVLQARGDLATARLELAQKRVQDPARGVPPTAPELASGRESVVAARTKLARVLARPLAADVAT